MKKIVVILLGFGAIFSANAQYAADLYKYSEIKTSGSARMQSIGGNHAAIGADASNFSGNPAGLGFYNRSELSFGFNNNKLSSSSTFIDGSTAAEFKNPKLNNFALVFLKPQGRNGSLRRSTWGVGFNRLNDFNTGFNYSGVNKKSSILDYYVAEANNRNLTPDKFDKNINKSGVTGVENLDYADVTLFYQGYLINPTTAIGAPYFRFDRNSAITQSGSYQAKGGTSQWSVSYSENYNDKFYWGASAGITSTNFESSNIFTEKNVTPVVFNGFSLTENLSVYGTGINFTLGSIYKLSPTLQIGASVQTPTYMNSRENYTQSLTIDPKFIPDEKGKKVDPAFTTLTTKDDLRFVNFNSPIRASGGLTYFIAKKGFITATAEYVGYSRMKARITEAYFDPTTTENQEIKNDILNNYANTINLRVGGEFKIKMISVRAGLASIPTSYRSNDNINRGKTILSAGLGYRNSGYFIDAGINRTSFQSAYTPYALNNTADFTSVKTENTVANTFVSIGKFF